MSPIRCFVFLFRNIGRFVAGGGGRWSFAAEIWGVGMPPQGGAVSDQSALIVGGPTPKIRTFRGDR